MSLFFAQYLYLLCIYKETGPRTRVSPAPQPLLPQLSDLFQVTQELPVILTDVFVPREIKVFLFNCLFGGGERCFLGVFPKMPKEGHFMERPPPAWSVRGFYLCSCRLETCRASTAHLLILHLVPSFPGKKKKWSPVCSSELELLVWLK